MKNLTRLLGIVALAAIIGFAMTACPDTGGGGGGGEPLTGSVSITGTPEVGAELTADISGLSGTGTVSYQWKRGTVAITGVRTAVYPLAAADVGYTVTVTVTRSGFSGSVTSQPTGFVTDPALPALTGTVGITGTPEVGETLTADISGLDGTGTVHYQWKRAGIVTGTDNVAYKTLDADKGFTITVTVTYTGNSGSKTSAPTAAITNPALPELTGTVSITGTGALGTALTADISALGGSGTISYQWNRDGTAAIPGADKSAYTVTAADVTHAITVTVTREDNNGSKTSAPVTAYDPAAPNIEGAVIIAINGDYAQVENILTATFLPDFGFTPVGTVHYQWKRLNGGSTVNTGGDTNTYTIADADIGYAITVAVSYSGNSGAISSRPTAVITKSTLAAFSATVSITGDAYVGETLTASVTAPSGNVGTRVYQWKRAGEEETVVVATGNNETSYNVTAADIGCTFTVTVSYTGNCNWITSEPTAAVIYPPLTGDVTISGTAEVGETLTAVTTALNGIGTASYQWKRGGSANIGTAGTYTVQLDDVGSTITVTVTRAGYSGSQTGGPTATVPPHLTGSVSISGTAKVGETLTADISALEGEGAITYQWKRGSTEIGTDSGGYVIQAEDAGSTITVTVTRLGYTGSKTSEPTAAVIILELAGTVSISGTAAVGQTLTAVTTALEGSGTISYQWKRVGTGGETATDIGTGSGTYVVQVADVGFTITVTVTRAFNSGSKTSDPTDVVPLGGTVTISGNAYVGETLTANTSGLGGTGTISYQWKRGTTNIGTNSSSYTLVTADRGYTITVTVTREGHTGSITSAATAAVILPPLTGTVSISGTAKVGETLTANTSSLGGSGAISYEWRLNGSSGTLIGTGTSVVAPSSPNPGSSYPYYISLIVTRAGYSGYVYADVNIYQY